MYKYWSDVWRLSDVGMMALLVFGVLGYAVSAVMLFSPSTPYAMLIVNSAVVFGTLAIFGGLAGYRNVPGSDLGFVIPRLRWVAAAILLGFGVVVIGLGLSFATDAIIGTGAADAGFSSEIFGSELWLTVVNVKILIAIGIPIAEELLFRDVLFRYLRQRRSFMGAALISAGIFAVLHIHPSLMIFAFILGLTSAALFERTGSILPSFLLHITINNMAATAVLATLL